MFICRSKLTLEGIFCHRLTLPKQGNFHLKAIHFALTYIKQITEEVNHRSNSVHSLCVQNLELAFLREKNGFFRVVVFTFF